MARYSTPAAPATVIEILQTGSYRSGMVRDWKRWRKPRRRLSGHERPKVPLIQCWRTPRYDICERVRLACQAE